MDVILLTDVPKLGRKFEVKNVKNGYGRNLLIPKGVAMIASESNLKKLEGLITKQAKEEAAKRAELIKNISALDGQLVTIRVRANEQGHLFEGLHVEQIAEAISDQLHLGVAPDWIKLSKPIKSVGNFTLEVKEGDETATFKLVVESDNNPA